jgi:hypothetical protein
MNEKKRFFIKFFAHNSIFVLPFLCFDREPGSWGPSCWWVSVGFLWWSINVTLYDWPPPKYFGGQYL